MEQVSILLACSLTSLLAGRIVRRKAFATLSEADADKVVAAFAWERRFLIPAVVVGLAAFMVLVSCAGLGPLVEHLAIFAGSLAVWASLMLQVGRKLVRIQAPQRFVRLFLLSRGVALAGSFCTAYAAYLCALLLKT